jgi:hypothetical protein
MNILMGQTNLFGSSVEGFASTPRTRYDNLLRRKKPRDRCPPCNIFDCNIQTNSFAEYLSDVQDSLAAFLS